MSIKYVLQLYRNWVCPSWGATATISIGNWSKRLLLLLRENEEKRLLEKCCWLFPVLTLSRREKRNFLDCRVWRSWTPSARNVSDAAQIHLIQESVGGHEPWIQVKGGEPLQLSAEPAGEREAGGSAGQKVQCKFCGEPAGERFCSSKHPHFYLLNSTQNWFFCSLYQPDFTGER